MLILLSPAKNLNLDPVVDVPRATKPRLLAETKELAKTTVKLNRADLKRLMGISDKLADLNYERFQSFKADVKAPGVKQAVLAFNGDVYWGLGASSFDKNDLKFAQDHLRILSGLYGALRPLDGIEPYRLEMGTKLKNTRGSTLLDFWGGVIAKELNTSMKGHDDKTIINLASKEYFSSVDRGILKHPVLNVAFKEIKDGKARILMHYAKRARGMMARWIIQNRISTIES